MNYDRFNSECIGVTITDWPHPLVGIFTKVDSDWGLITPIPESLPVSKQWKGVDSDIYFRFIDVKLIKHIKYVEYTKEQQQEKTDNPGKSASG